MNAKTSHKCEVRNLTKHVVDALAICGIAAVGTTALWIAIQQDFRLQTMERTLLHCVVYSFSIGSLCSIALPYTAHRFAKASAPLKAAVILSVIGVLTVIGCSIGQLVLVALGQYPLEGFFARMVPIFSFSIIIALVAGVGGYLYESMHYRLQETELQLRTRQLAEERAKSLAAEARLSSLESRIHPHFLFNTLNSIASLVPEEPQRAEQIVGRLAALLRFSLDANQQSLVPLEQELKIVRDYLEIESARFGQRLRYSIEAPPQAGSALVPPLSIESLVENSVKHVVAHRREGGEIQISIRQGQHGLEIEVADDGPGFELSNALPGHGVDNLIARLDVLYGGSASLQTGHRDGYATVRLVLPERL